ncbi:uncharacterized protein LOC144443522 [Glandiceps talaboti]
MAATKLLLFCAVAAFMWQDALALRVQLGNKRPGSSDLWNFQPLRHDLSWNRMFWDNWKDPFVSNFFDDVFGQTPRLYHSLLPHVRHDCSTNDFPDHNPARRNLDNGKTREHDTGQPGHNNGDDHQDHRHDNNCIRRQQVEDEAVNQERQFRTEKQRQAEISRCQELERLKQDNERRQKQLENERQQLLRQQQHIEKEMRQRDGVQHQQKLQLERQHQEELRRQGEAQKLYQQNKERERQREIELQRQRQEELNRQREAEKLYREQQQNKERERLREIELQRQRQEELNRQREAEKLYREQQQNKERERQRELELQRQREQHDRLKQEIRGEKQNSHQSRNQHWKSQDNQHHRNRPTGKTVEIFSLIVKDYDPEDFRISTRGNFLKLSGMHVCRCNENCFEREFERKVAIPRGVDTQSLSATYNRDGVLRIEGVQYRYDVPQVDTNVQVHGLGLVRNTAPVCNNLKSGIKLKKLNKNTGEVFDDIPMATSRTPQFENEIDNDGVTIETDEY